MWAELTEDQRNYFAKYIDRQRDSASLEAIEQLKECKNRHIQFLDWALANKVTKIPLMYIDLYEINGSVEKFTQEELRSEFKKTLNTGK